MILKPEQIRTILLVLCMGLASVTSVQADFQSDSVKIVTKLFAQQVCWNRGDIDCFMQTYWRSDSLKFIGKDGITYGWQATIDRYRKKYPDQSRMGALSFQVLEIEYLGPNTIMLVGKWELKRAMRAISVCGNRCYNICSKTLDHYKQRSVKTHLPSIKRC